MWARIVMRITIVPIAFEFYLVLSFSSKIDRHLVLVNLHQLLRHMKCTQIGNQLVQSSHRMRCSFTSTYYIKMYFVIILQAGMEIERGVQSWLDHLSGMVNIHVL